MAGGSYTSIWRAEKTETTELRPLLPTPTETMLVHAQPVPAVGVVLARLHADEVVQLHFPDGGAEFTLTLPPN